MGVGPRAPTLSTSGRAVFPLEAALMPETFANTVGDTAPHELPAEPQAIVKAIDGRTAPLHC